MATVIKAYCKYCGRAFFTRDHDKHFCNSFCEDLYKMERDKGDKLKPRRCKNCNKEFKPDYVHQRYCCSKCRDAYQTVIRRNLIIKEVYKYG